MIRNFKPLTIILLSTLFAASSAMGAAFQFGGLRLDYLQITSSGSATSLTKGDKQVASQGGVQGGVFKLPDATTLQSGYFFLINNSSTNALTVSNSSSTALGTLGERESAFLFLTSSSTSGGPWNFMKMQADNACTVPGPAIAGVVTIDWRLGPCFDVTLTVNTTFSFANQPAYYKAITIHIHNSASNYTVAYPGGVLWPAASTPTETTGAKADVVTCTYTGNLGTPKTYCNAVQNF